MRLRIAFDLDETLGTPIIDSNSISGFNIRKGSIELLELLKKNNTLILWTVSKRLYLNKVLSYGLEKYFEETYSWDELECRWKDIRLLNIDYLIDDSEHHRIMAQKYNLDKQYIIVPSYGSPEDIKNPNLWIDLIKGSLNIDT